VGKISFYRLQMCDNAPFFVHMHSKLAISAIMGYKKTYNFMLISNLFIRNLKSWRQINFEKGAKTENSEFA